MFCPPRCIESAYFTDMALYVESDGTANIAPYELQIHAPARISILLIGTQFEPRVPHQ